MEWISLPLLETKGSHLDLHNTKPTHTLPWQRRDKASPHSRDARAIRRAAIADEADAMATSYGEMGFEIMVILLLTGGTLCLSECVSGQS
jgi:hypothetical protein